MQILFKDASPNQNLSPDFINRARFVCHAGNYSIPPVLSNPLSLLAVITSSVSNSMTYFDFIIFFHCLILSFFVFCLFMFCFWENHFVEIGFGKNRCLGCTMITKKALRICISTDLQGQFYVWAIILLVGRFAP